MRLVILAMLLTTLVPVTGCSCRTRTEYAAVQTQQEPRARDQQFEESMKK